MIKILPSLIEKISNLESLDSNVINWSSPVPSFGDINKSKVATLGLNPSNREFVDKNGIELDGINRRFHTLNSLNINGWSDANKCHIRLIEDSCRDYFFINPYDNWFKSLDTIINGLNTSYYDLNNQACHLDLVPYATSCKWGNLTVRQKQILLTNSGDSLAKLLYDSPVRILVLNGISVVDGLKSISTIKLNKMEIPAWSLPRKSGRHVKGYSYRGELKDLLGIKFKKKILVLGYNHNIQSSFGVTTFVKESIRTWIKDQGKEI